MRPVSGFIRLLSEAVSRDPLREKLLLVPSHRVGRQWLDQAAAAAGGAANVRTVTMHRLILDRAEAGLRRKGLRVPSRQEKTEMMALALAETAAAAGDRGYFSRLPVTVTLAEAMLSAAEELENAAVRSTAAIRAGIAVPDKARELTRLLRVYAAARRERGLASAEDIHRAALAGLTAKRAAPLPLLLIPEWMAEDMTSLEWGFLSRWPVESRQRLEETADGGAAEISLYAADTAASEAREVFRRLQAGAIPLDTAEVVCLDERVSVPALCTAGLECFGGRPEDLPMTFAGGLPGGYSRPVRLLTAWLEWLGDGLPAEGLARMLDAGLTGDGWRDNVPGVSAPELAARLRRLPIGGGPAGYRQCLGKSGAGSPLQRAESWLGGWMWDCVPLTPDGSAAVLDEPGTVLDAAARLLRAAAGGDGKLDAYARLSLTESIAQWRPHCEWPGFDARQWLRNTAERLRVMGLGPQPGRLHVSGLDNGGHAGRQHLFVLGLDDSRFPGGSRQDPVLLDKERSAISNGLPRSGRRRLRREKAFARLLQQAGGTVTLSYAASDSGGRGSHPAAVFTRLAAECGRPPVQVTLKPARPDAALCRRDSWLHQLLAGPKNSLTAADLAPWYPGLAGGRTAELARASSRFTEYDGKVPEAGADWRREQRTLSPTDMELMASCPLEFFFRRILEIRPAERYEPKPGRWLPGNARGSLLHDLFQDFLNELARLGQPVETARLSEHGSLLRRMLEAAVARERRRFPVRDALAGRREERELAEACGIFLDHEAERHRKGRPLCLEAALGGAKEDAPPWNRAEPVELLLDSGELLRLKGRVDRIDRLHDHGGLVIFDYKTGLSDKFSRDDPFRQGRHLQPLLYTRMLERALEEAGSPEPVRGFAYFFPMPRDEGRTIFYSREMLGRKGMEIVGALAAMLTAGVFPFTSDPADVRYSDFAPVYGNVRLLAAAARNKAENDPALAAWAGLRGIGEGEEDGDDE